MNHTLPGARNAPRSGWPMRKTAALVALLAGTAMTVGALAQNAAGGGWHHHGQMAAASPADVASHVDAVLQHIYTEVDATPAQQQQIEPIVRTAALDLVQRHTDFHAEHGKMRALLAADQIDRVALENSRAAQVNVIDQASREILQVITDTADVLTPAQRKALAAKLSAHLGASSG